ncbi:hypothetical protein FXW07_08450 [Methanosarcina sp. DH1]|nr:hypothetical protein [Methanosarcina sp. DH1]MCC4766639.1 hypothetical protein [Methanosarcina sp. DH1]
MVISFTTLQIIGTINVTNNITMGRLLNPGKVSEPDSLVYLRFFLE